MAQIRLRSELLVFLVLVAVASTRPEARAESPSESEAATLAFSGSEPVASSAGVELSRVASDPCAQTEVISSPSRPTWTSGASTAQCGVLETDLGWTWQSMSGRQRQWLLSSTMRYGLNSRLELDWELPGHSVQDSNDAVRLVGTTDQSLGFLYRFKEQAPRTPALALSYGIKIPTANPKKEFGTGYVDHNLVFVASHDLKWVHVDFNTVGTLAGSSKRMNGTTQFGLAASVPISRKISGIVDSFGGSEPGETERYGALLTSATWAVHPWLVLDVACSRQYAGDAPQQRITFGVTYASRPGFGRLLRHPR